MTTKATFIPMFILSLILTGFSLPNEKAGGLACMEESGDSTSFEWVRGEGGIDIYTRWIPVDDQRAARQVKVNFEVEADIEKVIGLLSDEGSYLQWMRSAKEYYRVNTIDAYNWYSYVQFSIPWPLKNQDCILKYEVAVTDDPDRKVIRVFGAPDYTSKVDGVERISHMEVTWVITRAGENRAKVEYYAYSNQPPKFPTWLTDPIIQKNLLRTMKALQEILAGEEEKYASS